MDELEQVMDILKGLFEKYGIRGRFVEQGSLSPQDLPINNELLFYFEQFNPVDVKIDTGASPFKLIEWSSLSKAQLGYRWNANTVEPTVGWNLEDVVIGDDFGGGRPVIARMNDKSCNVYASYEGVVPFEIADSLVNFLRALSSLIDLVYGEYDIFEINDDDESVKEDFTKKIKDRLVAILGGDNSERFYDYYYG